jgi:hypothetical protein
MNNIYIITEVLCDYTSGMVVIAAPSLERCKELFLDEFDSRCRFNHKFQFERSIKNGNYKVVEAANASEGIISYVYGGL